jgi:uncharacterized protein YbcI
MIREITSTNVVSLHHDISTITGKDVLIFTLAEPPRFREIKKQTSSRSAGSRIGDKNPRFSG